AREQGIAKAGKSQAAGAFLDNARDSAMGRHRGCQVALGGVGNRNPFSGVEVQANGCHGHLYVNYRAPTYKKFGCMLVGCEGSAVGAASDQVGKVHDTAGSKGRWSPTGAEKWKKFMEMIGGRIYE